MPIGWVCHHTYLMTHQKDDWQGDQHNPRLVFDSGGDMQNEAISCVVSKSVR